MAMQIREAPAQNVSSDQYDYSQDQMQYGYAGGGGQIRHDDLGQGYGRGGPMMQDQSLDESYSRQQQYQQAAQQKVYTYDKVSGLQIGKGWLMDNKDRQTTGHKYREHILHAMFQARDKYVARKREKGERVAASVTKSANEFQNKNLRTVHPEIPDFSIKKKMSKIGGACVAKEYERFFTVDEDNFQYFVGKDVKTPKKSLLIKGSEAFIQTKQEHSAIRPGDNKTQGHEPWSQANDFFRVGIKLKDRPAGPIYYYTKDIHEAKFLFVNIRLHGDQYKKNTISNKLQMLQNIERITRFQKIIQLMSYAKEKRFVRMNQFQLLSLQMVEIAQQAKKFQAKTISRWFANMLDDEEVVKIRSAFRTRPPEPQRHYKKKNFNEDTINKDIKALKTFVSRRRMNRAALINQEINRQLYEESTGISVQSLILTELDEQSGQNKKILDIKNNQAALMFDNEQSYKYMTIENKQLHRSQSSRQRQSQPLDLIRKLNLGDVSFISTDLHQNNQFDFNNRIHPQQDYTIRLYGPVRSMRPVNPSQYQQDQVLPSDLGLDCLRASMPSYTLQIRKITFPSYLSSQENKKVTLNVKVYQYRNRRLRHGFEATSKAFHLKNVKTGELFGDGEQFNLNKLSSLDARDEVYAIGVVVRTNAKPIPRVMEKYMSNQREMRSSDGPQPVLFTYDKLTQEQKVTLQDKNDPSFKCTVSFALNLTNHQVEPLPLATERSGKRLLVGRYVLARDNKPCYVRSVNSQGKLKIVDIFSKIDQIVDVEQVRLIETAGVNVFQLGDNEPVQIQQAEYEWQLQIKTSDKRLLNQIASKIQMRQTYLQRKQQDTFTRDDFSTIQGNLIVSVLEAKGLILPQEMNRSNIDKSKQIDPVVEVRLETFSNQIVKQYSSQPITNKRQVIFGTYQNKIVADQVQEFQVDLGMINHSGKVYDKANEQSNYDSQNNLYKQESEKYIHFLVRDNSSGQEIGSARIIIDELIDTNLFDLAKELCVGLDRQPLIKQMMSSGKYPKDIELYTHFSGIIKFQTLFQPTPDTCLRFQKLRDTQDFTSPKQLLHFEHLLEKNDFDEFRFKIPQVFFNPNNKNMGENEIDLQNLIDQTSSKPQLQQFFQRLQNHEEDDQMSIVKQAAQGNQKVSEELFQQIDSSIKFQSPFEQVYIILKLQRKERPLVEPIFYQLKNVWDIHIQDLKNKAYNQLTYTEWRSFFHQYEIEERIAKEPGQDRVYDYEPLDDRSAMDQSDDLTQKSFIQEQRREATQNVNYLMRKSTLHAEMQDKIEEGQPFAKKSKREHSLIPTLLWEKEGKQEFTDLFNLIKGGIPSILRPFVWSELLCAKIYEKQQKRVIIKNPDKFPKKLISKQSLFNYYLDISLKYDCNAFRQIDQDILDFKFPASYYEETGADNSQFKQPLPTGSDNEKEFKLSRQNKMKQDKQKMRKLMRILVVWGKTFQHLGKDYQFCYSTGFLKFVHRIINIMTLEDAFLIIISMMRQNPRLFCLHNSSMLGDGKSNFRFEMGAFRAILQANFPSVCKKLQDLGVSVESLVYDSITSFYCDMFHSETLFRIWDQIIFYMVTDADLPMSDATETQRKAIWQIFAPAIFVISQKRDQILAAQTIEEVFIAYRDGCGVNYNPNHVIQEIYELIDEIFITQGQRKTIIKDSKVKSTSVIGGTTGGSGSLVEVSGDATGRSGLFGGILSGFLQGQVQSKKVDEVRRNFHQKLQIIHDWQRTRNAAVSEFLFQVPSSQGDRPAEIGDNSMAFPGRKAGGDFEDDDDLDMSKGMRLHPQQVLDYRKWRQQIIPALSESLLGQVDRIDDDLYEFEEVDIFSKKTLDIKVIHIYLHDLDHYYGNSDGDMNFIIQIQYGERKKGGKFEVKHFTREDDPNARMNSENLQYYWHFKYSPGYNTVKVKMMTLDEQPISKCYIDLHGLQRGRFIHLKKPMNSQEITQNGESKFSLTQLKLSMLIQKGKDKGDNNQNYPESDQQTQLIYQYSMKRYNPNFVNIYKMGKEKKFQDFMAQGLQSSVQFDFSNLEKVLQNQELAVDIVNQKYNYIKISPEQRFGHLDERLFREFLRTCFTQHFDTYNLSDRNQLYKKFLTGDGKAEGKQDIKPAKKAEEASVITDLYSRWASLDVQQNEGQKTTVNLKERLTEQQSFTTRAFILNTLFQSPITVKEKLDVMYDFTNQANKYVDGIDIHDALMIFETVLRQHLYYIPYNELRSQVERVYNTGRVAMIVGAYWTKRDSGSIKFDMPKNDKAGFCTLEKFMGTGYFESANSFQTIDVTSEVQSTFQMYVNLYGNKILDFNDDISPFKSLNSILAGNGNHELGTDLMKRTTKYGRYRLCIISHIAGGERHLTELRYDASGKIQIPNEKQPTDQQEFKRFFQRNINILDLQGRPTSLTKQEFMEGTMKMPFVGDLLRAETLWQDRKYLGQQRDGIKQKKTSLRVKQKCQPVVLVFMSDKDNVFIFKFEKVSMPKTQNTYIVELSKNVYMFELQALNLEDIILDMRDRITNELLKVERRGYININGRDITFRFSDNFIQEVDGKMEFFVRRVKRNDPRAQRTSITGQQQSNIETHVWQWAPLNDFDRMEKFADLGVYQDEVFEDQVIFKLINTSGEDAADIEEYQDDKPKHIVDGYDCYSIYKHQDNSYEWRLCKIIKTELKPEYKFNAIQAFQELGQAKIANYNLPNSGPYQSGQGKMTQEQDKYWYYLEFEHLREYGEEMWFKRRREDIIFSSRYSRDQPDFEKTCFQFIIDAYRK